MLVLCLVQLPYFLLTTLFVSLIIIFNILLILFSFPVFTIIASSLFSKGLFFRFLSLKFLSFIDFLTSFSLIFLSFFLSSLNLLFEAVLRSQIKKNFMSAFGKITVPISRPSIQILLYFFENFFLI